MNLGIIVFIFSVIGTWTAMHWYVFHNLAALGLHRGLLIPVLWCLALTFPFTRLFSLRWNHPLLRWLYWFGALWMGSIFMLSFWFLIASGIRRILKLAGVGAAAQPAPWILAAILGVFAMIAWGLFNAKRGPKEVRFAVDRSGRYRKGKRVRIVQISDVHLGLTLGTDFLRKLVGRINGLEPDLVFITGDLFDPEFPSDREASAILSGLTAKQGTFAVSGNHEFYSGLGRFLEMMKAAGIAVLDNEVRTIGTGLQIAGIHDQTANRFTSLGVSCDLPKAIHDINHDMPSFLLAHQPKDLEPAQAAQVDLIFSGHTHAGQVFPFRAVVRMAYRYLGGRYALGAETDLIVNTGTGFWGPPLRVGTDSQIVVVDFAY
jgi:predicted MPP superfamily phosphohydrolase